ncbi:MAG: M50 family metallopeptidase [Pirellulales bacterium]|nr:M50 family metallopeptidase [Pirellulales bacterium]
MHRAFQCLLIVSTVAFCWLAMMVVHESGHVLHAWLSGGSVERIVLHPAAFSRTDVRPNPHPLLVAWGGAVWGCLIPLAILLLVRWAVRSQTYLAAFFAGFCLIANGAYLAVGSLMPDGDDAGVVLTQGGAQWQLLLFGVLAVAGGLWLWNGLGPNFGLGPAKGQVDRRAAVGVTLAWVLLAVAELALSR